MNVSKFNTPFRGNVSCMCYLHIFTTYSGVVVRCGRYSDSEHEPELEIADADKNNKTSKMSRDLPPRYKTRQPTPGDRSENTSLTRHILK